MAVNAEWLKWTREAVERGCAAAEIRGILKRNGFNDADVKYALKKAVPKQAYRKLQKKLTALEQHRGRNADLDYRAMARPKLVENVDGENIICVMDQPLQIYLLPNFLDADYCARMVDIINANAVPSTVSTKQRPDHRRTSSTCHLHKMDHPLVGDLDDRISSTLGLSLAWSEPNQGQTYAVGQEFKEHVDYFQLGTDDFERFGSETGQRTWTFMIYLSETERGGDTRFTRINRQFEPSLGTALCWNNLRPDGSVNRYSEHQGLPVEAGNKVIITKWFRDRGEGPPFCD